MPGTVKTRQELAGTPTSPFSLGQKPKDIDYDNLLASVLFPGEDTAARLAVDETTANLFLEFFQSSQLPQDPSGRRTLQGLLCRLLVWADQRLSQPQTVPIGPSVAYVSEDSFSVPADVTAQLLVGSRVRASLSGTMVYGTVESRAWNGTITTVALQMDPGNALTTALSAVDLNLVDPNLIGPGLLNGALIAAALGYTPANKAGDTFGGLVTAGGFKVGDGARYGKLTVTTSVPGETAGEDGDLWIVYE